MQWQTIRLWLTVLALLALSVAGFWGVGQEWHSADTYGRQFSTFMQTAYAVFGLLAVLALLRKWASARFLLYVWTATLLLTAATAPVMWSQADWKQSLLAVGVTGVIALIVLWLAPLPSQGKGSKLWLWSGLTVLILSASTLVIPALRYAPVIGGARHMEAFCAGLREDLDRKQLGELAASEGYKASDQTDKKGPFVRLDDPANPGDYYCAIRYKSDGKMDSINFTAGPQKAIQPSK